MSKRKVREVVKKEATEEAPKTQNKDEVLQTTITYPDPAESDRMKLMQEIADRNEAEDTFTPIEEMEDHADYKEKEPEVKDEEVKESEEKEEETGEEEEEKADDKTEETEDQDETETYVVDGEEHQASKKELLALGKTAKQKIEAADKRFREAADLKKEVNDLLSQVKEGQGRKPSDKDVSESKIIDEQMQQMIDKVASSISDLDDKEEIAEHLSELFKQVGQSKTGPTEEELAEKVVSRVRFIETEEKFAAQFSDIVKDEEAFTIARSLFSREMEKGSAPDWSTYERIGNKVMKMYSMENPEKKNTPKTGQTLEEKREKKKKLDIVKGVNQAAKSIPKDDEGPKTRKEIMEQMAKARIV